MGNLQSISIYQEQTKIELDTKLREIYNEAMSLYIELQALEKQINMQKNNLQNNLALLNAEQDKFKLGESSVFMVNTRENAYLSAEINLIELISKQQTMNNLNLFTSFAPKGNENKATGIKSQTWSKSKRFTMIQI